METRWLTGSQIVIETLIEQGVTDVFGYPGGQVLSIYDELYKASDRIKHYLTAHEQGAAHAADGYSRVTGKVGVVIATSGPGATNLVTGIATAMLDSIPMVAITGNVPSIQIGTDSFQEINITGVTMPITKHNYFVTDVNELADILREAFRIAKSGRPGPVLVDIPKDVQLASAPFDLRGAVEPYPKELVDEASIHEAVKLINQSKKPYIYVGGGAAGAGIGKEIIDLAERTDAYIGCSFMGLSAIPHSHPRFLGMQGMHGKHSSSMASRAADLLIGIGVRFSDRSTGGRLDGSKPAIIQLDADLAEINKNVKVDVGLVGDIAHSLKRITECCKKQSHKQWHSIVEGYTDRIVIDEKLTPQSIFEVINAVKDDDTVVVTDVGQHQMWTAQYIKLEKERRFASSGGLGTMGYGLGAAIGARIASGNKTLLITGDGSFGMNLNELATVVSYDLPIVIVIFNNGSLGMVRQWQGMYYGGRYSSSELNRKTDFVKLAEAFGLSACRVSTAAEFKSAFEKAINGNGPYLIDAVIDIEEKVLPINTKDKKEV